MPNFMKYSFYIILVILLIVFSFILYSGCENDADPKDEIEDYHWSFKGRVSVFEPIAPEEVFYELELHPGKLYAELTWTPRPSLLGLYLYQGGELIAQSDCDVEWGEETQTINIVLEDSGEYVIEVRALERHGNFNLTVNNLVK